MATVDVLIPVYNGAKTVRESVESVQRQTFDDFTIVLVDDGSTDDTAAILAEMASRDPRIRVHRKANGGIVDAMNDGLELCTSEFLARLDADDICYPNRLEVQIAYLRANPAVVAVGAAVRHIDAASAQLGTIARLGSPDLADAYFVPSAEPYIIHPFLTARRAAIETAGRYRHVHYAEDTDLYWRLRDLGKLVNLDDLLGEYRMHNESISGASILNARIASINSQLASVSEQRRRRGERDLVFEKESLAAYKKAGTLAAMVALASESLDPSERRYMAEATAAKLLELAAYRPFELDAADCAFVGDLARRGFGHLPAINAGLIDRRISGTAARIAAAGRMRDALRMVPARLWYAFAPRYLSRAVLPRRLSQRLRGRYTRQSAYK